MTEIQIQGDFDLDEDYRKIRAKIKPADDPFLHVACTYRKGIRILRQDPWETLVSFIISQNKNIPSIKNCIAMLCATAGKSITDNMGAEEETLARLTAVLGIGVKVASFTAMAEEHR